jgi:hypothetical protein
LLPASKHESRSIESSFDPSSPALGRVTDKNESIVVYELEAME